MRFDKKDIKIPNGTTIIGEGVFENFTSLRAIDVPDGVEIIEKDAFFGCKKVKGDKFAKDGTRDRRWCFCFLQ